MKIIFPFTIIKTSKLAEYKADKYYLNEYRDRYCNLLSENKKLQEELRISKELERITRRKLMGLKTE